MRFPRSSACSIAALIVVASRASAGCKAPSPGRSPAAVVPAAAAPAGSSKPDAAPAAPAAKTPVAPKEPASHVTGRGSIKRVVQFDAVLEAVEMHPVCIEPKAWADLTVVEAAAHGARVRAGDALVRLDTDKLREQIADLEQDAPAAAIALEMARAELASLKEATPHRLAAARRSRRVVDEDQEYFEKEGRERRIRAAKFNVQSAEQRLANAEEELKQLRQMYEADDLTEQTEEIILKRQEFEVETAAFSLDHLRASSEREIETAIPRETENLQSQKRDQGLALALAEETLPKALTRKELEVEKLARDQKKAQKRLDDLKADLAALDVRAPADGVVMYGACEAGRWTTGPVVTKKLVRGGKLAPYEIFMTVVNPDRFQLKAVVPEADLGKTRIGMAGEAAPVALPNRKLPVKIESVDRVPLVTGGFGATLSLTPSGPRDLQPGMNCKVTLTDTSSANALVAPVQAVLGEGDEKHVFVRVADGKAEKRAVRTGESDGQNIEIVEGLAEGDTILLSKPE